MAASREVGARWAPGGGAAASRWNRESPGSASDTYPGRMSLPVAEAGLVVSRLRWTGGGGERRGRTGRGQPTG